MSRTSIAPKASRATAPRLIVRSSETHAAGAAPPDPTRRGARVVEYDGPRISKEAADDRYAERIVTYLFGVGERGEVIDGFGTAMFINHSCAPNCETLEKEERIYIIALRDIAAGEELLYEYHLYDSDHEVATSSSGAPNRPGTILSD